MAAVDASKLRPALKIHRLTPNFVSQFPEDLEEGTLYISQEFSLTAHKCCCGCGEDVYNKLGPAKWRLTKNPDGSVTLDPSIGNWKYKCKSHYWIRRNRVIDAGRMTPKQIHNIQEKDRRDRDAHIASINRHAGGTPDSKRGWKQRTQAALSGGLESLKSWWRKG
jgi:hypothetical protein